MKNIRIDQSVTVLSIHIYLDAPPYPSKEGRLILASTDGVVKLPGGVSLSVQCMKDEKHET